MLGTLLTAMMVSVGIWMIFYFVISPGEPLDGNQTTVVAGLSLVLVIAARWIVRKSKRGAS